MSSIRLRPAPLMVGVLALTASIAWSGSAGLPEGLTPEGARTLGVAALMAIWWIFSGLPLAVPSLVPLALFPLLGILDSKRVAAPYADRMVMLLMCGFLLSLAVEKWGLHRRLALRALVAVGRGPGTLLAGVMAVTAGLSMWISNTATTLMMLPIVLALGAQGMAENDDDPAAGRRFRVLLLLGLAYSASIGGMATPIGTPPNLIFQSVFAETFPEAPGLDFAEWMAVGLPLSATLLVLVGGLLHRVLLPVPDSFRLGARTTLKARLDELGGWTRPERRVAVGFALTAVAWVARGPLQRAEFLPREVHDSTIAAIAVVLFFLLPAGDAERRPLLQWSDSVRVPWGLLLLFGGGIALSLAFAQTGLTTFLASRLTGLSTVPTPLLVAGVAVAVTFLTEMTSNTATTALMLPVLAATAQATGTEPLLLMLPAVFAASCAFMLPVATAPNAIVVGSGVVEQTRMARTGLVINLAAVVPITIAVLLAT